MKETSTIFHDMLLNYEMKGDNCLKKKTVSFIVHFFLSKIIKFNCEFLGPSADERERKKNEYFSEKILRWEKRKSIA